MNIFAGKTPTERNKMIAAAVLGALSLFSLYFAFGGSIFSSRPTTVTVKTSPTPTPAAQTATEAPQFPTDEQILMDWTTTPVVYNPNAFYAADAGRNIFAFYEPPPPTPYSPTPIPPPTPEVIKTPEPTPTPPILIGFVTPQSVYAGSKTFRLEVAGDKFTPDSQIIFNGSSLPTTYISPQQLVAEIPEVLIQGEGTRTVMVTTPGGLYSNQMTIGVQAPPKPQFQYIGMIGRKRYNNDTAYFQEQGKKTPFGARLNDVVGGRFRLVSISSGETVFEDVSLGFKHKVQLYRPAPGQTTATQQVPSGVPDDPYAPPAINNQRQSIPGIPDNIPIYQQQQRNTPRPQDNQEKKEDVNDEDGDN